MRWRDRGGVESVRRGGPFLVILHILLPIFFTNSTTSSSKSCLFASSTVCFITMNRSASVALLPRFGLFGLDDRGHPSRRALLIPPGSTFRCHLKFFSGPSLPLVIIVVCRVRLHIPTVHVLVPSHTGGISFIVTLSISRIVVVI